MRLLISSVFAIAACATAPGLDSHRGGPTDPAAAEAPAAPHFLALASPSDAGHVHDEHVHAEATAAEEPVYVCPMHPDVTSHEPGQCPKCHMKLVPRKPQSTSARP